MINAGISFKDSLIEYKSLLQTFVWIMKSLKTNEEEEGYVSFL